MPDFFNQEAAKSYDEKNSKLSAIADNMHFLTRLVLKELPVRSRVLCVGVGTGAEIVSLSKVYPQWSFVGVDPSASMLEVCRERLTRLGVIDRCELIHGYVENAPVGENFDAALSILVGHFVKREDRPAFFQNIAQRLRKGGVLVNTEISFDLNSAEFPSMVKNWESVQKLLGATPESLATLPQVLRDVLTVLSPSEVEAVMKQSGFATPVRFFQSFMICGWYAKR